VCLLLSRLYIGMEDDVTISAVERSVLVLRPRLYFELRAQCRLLSVESPKSDAIFVFGDFKKSAYHYSLGCYVTSSLIATHVKI
jgi:hypothetical protein